MTNQILSNGTEDFILKYRAAAKVKLTREQLAAYLQMEPRSVLRKKQKIKQHIGFDLPILKSDPQLALDKDTKDKFEAVLKTMADSILKAEKVNNVAQKTKINIQKNKVYVITSAQNATPIFAPFLKTLERYSKEREAQLVVIPYRYKNPTSVWTEAKNDYWHADLVPYLLDEESKVGKHIRIMGNIKIQPTASSPLSGFESVSGLDSAIFGHPTVEWKTISSVADKSPKILVSTGSVTVPNYTDSKAGHKGAYHHTYSAIVLEIDEDETFHIRQITANDKGHFYDLDVHYTQNTSTSGKRALALVAGDIHAEVVSVDVVEALFTGDNSVAARLQPQHFVFHDLIDGSARSHHNIRDALGRYRKHLYNDNNNVEESMQIVANFIESVSRPNTQNHIVKSNHDEHIDRWLREADPAVDPENAKFYHYLKYHQYRSVYENTHFDAIKFWCENPDEFDGMDPDVFERTHFLTRNENFEIGGIELSLHGDVGPNGSRGSLKSLARMGQKLIIGHSHTPGISNGSYQVGTTSKLRLDYNKGPSSWLNTAAIVYPDGNVTLINVINGKWNL
jgi:hypothetical protein